MISFEIMEIKATLSKRKRDCIAIDMKDFGFLSDTRMIFARKDDHVACKWKEVLKSYGQRVFEFWNNCLEEMGFGMWEIIKEKLVNSCVEE
ncbi:hypothetical protein HanRHA438_Chr17g0818301 [Helianthus annuus]|nr:hypothetical protein HanRHA438_Chr17g0818301 [Helianthus annuus]